MRYKSRLMLLLVTLASIMFFGCASTAPPYDGQTAVLNQLRNEINAVYGFRNGAPRINLGPCGRFAKAFREEWNTRFAEKINIIFVMSPDETQCYHVLVKLPDGDYYDGGNGVISRAVLLKQYGPGTRLDEMRQFDLDRLDKWSYGLGRTYELCPNYSDDITIGLIKHHLGMLQR